MLFVELMSGGKCGKRRKFDFYWVGLQTLIVLCFLSHSNEKEVMCAWLSNYVLQNETMAHWSLEI